MNGLIFETDARGYSHTWRCACPLGNKHARGSLTADRDGNEQRSVIPLYGSKPAQKITGRDRAAGKDD